MSVLNLDHYRIERQVHSEQPEIDGEDIMNYVYHRISFHLQEEIYEVIDDIFAETWNSMTAGDAIDPAAITGSISLQLRDAGILLTPNRTGEVVGLMLEYLTREGLADPYIQ